MIRDCYSFFYQSRTRTSDKTFCGGKKEIRKIPSSHIGLILSTLITLASISLHFILTLLAIFILSFSSNLNKYSLPGWQTMIAQAHLAVRGDGMKRKCLSFCWLIFMSTCRELVLQWSELKEYGIGWNSCDPSLRVYVWMHCIQLVYSRHLSVLFHCGTGTRSCISHRGPAGGDVFPFKVFFSVCVCL